MKLYYSPGACSLTVRIVINELGLTSEYEKVDLRTKKTKNGDDFYKFNAKGAVPALETKTGEILTEVAVIIQYLADLYHNISLLPPVDDIHRYRVLELVNYISTELHKGCSPLFNSAIPTEIKDSVFKPALQNKLAFVNQLLGNKPYLYGTDFTLADAYLFVILSWMPHLQIDMSSYPNLTRYFDTLKNRPSVVKSLAEEQA